jgi:hypothetical protein
MESYSGMILTGEKQRPWRKPCPSATSSTINPTGTDLGFMLLIIEISFTNMYTITYRIQGNMLILMWIHPLCLT